MSDDKLRILVIGCGSIGRRHIRLLQEMGVEVRGFDTNLEACHRVMDELGILPYRGELDEVLKANFNGAIIATPNHLHREPAVTCIRAGISVLVEKPIAHSIGDALWIANTARDYGEDWRVKLLVGYSLRFHPVLHRIKEQIDSGAIGTVRHARLWFGSYLPSWRPGADYRTNYAASPETGGGILMDASHELDYACWLLGDPVEVSCTMQNSGALDIATEDIADVTLRFASGAQANIHLDYLNQQYDRGCVIVGDKGTLMWRFDAAEVSPDDMYRAELSHFLAALRGEEQPLVTAADGLRAVALVEAAKQAAQEGKVVRL